MHESRELVSLLMQVDLDQHIPPELYVVVAELLAWLYILNYKEGSSIVPHSWFRCINRVVDGAQGRLGRPHCADHMFKFVWF